MAKACSSADPDAIADWSEEWVEIIVKLSGVRITPQLPVCIQSWIDEVEQFAKAQLLRGNPTVRECALPDAQFVIARSHGFESWPKFAKQLQALARKNSSVSTFEAAADTIVYGDLATLKHLLRENSELVRARSNREHGAALLHYVSANGVEGYRQKTPANIIEITEQLLNGGAEIDARADVYGGGCTALGLIATSVRPERAGIQESLLQVLLDHGADHRAALDCRPWKIHCERVPGERASQGRCISRRSRRIPLALLPSLPSRRFRHTHCLTVVDFLLAQGADAALGDGQTALHRAVIGAHLNTVKLPLRNNPALERENKYGGTVIDQALWSAAQGGDPDVYLAILEALAAAGAKLAEFHVPVNTRIDAWFAER
jgi:hypothetical protein